MTSDATLHDALFGLGLHNAIYEAHGFDVVPAAMDYKGDVDVFRLKKVLSKMRHRYDFIILDSSPSYHEMTPVIAAADKIFVVTTPDHPTLSATIKAVKLAKQRGTPISGLVLNKVHKKNFEISLKDIEETLDIPVLAVIPYDLGVLKSLSRMKPYPSSKPKSRGSTEYKKLASALIGQKYGQSKLKNFFGKITPKRQEINREIFYNRVFKK